MRTAKQPVKNAPSPDIIHENIRAIDLVNDFWAVARECRESSYYLSGLEELLLVQANPLEVKVTNFVTRIRELKDSFFHLDELLLVKRLIEISEKLVPFVPQATLGSKELYNVTKSYIEIRTSMDKVQVEIIEYLTGIVVTKIKKLVEGIEQLKPLQQHYELGARMGKSFFHSIDVDKIATYKFYVQDREVDRELKMIDINLSQLYKIRDYSVLIEQKRQQYRYWHDAYAALLLAAPKAQEEQEFKLLEKKQHSYSFQVAVLTYIIGALTFATLVFGGISTYYAYKDHIPTMPIKSGGNNGGRVEVKGLNFLPAH
ncbi:hypothetical protein [Desulfosporosinus metallidurans]|uniref:Uncharacterized protein n=1 Tax=Desulfosporosinus metallidurans TaxID=1888891 RepID=A0A1Q8QMF1_9FIRM|nr:hypothetical protein [Desulfosporosinus metallidurans]OLN28517.1 hypothetical protein DSOL_4030 [Desulfosporosinus metallidurans]